MPDPVTITNLAVTGRAQARDPRLEDVFITYNANFNVAAAYELDFTIVNQQQIFGVPKSVFIDNGSNPNTVEVYVTNTDQFFVVPPFASGNFTLNAANGSRLQFSSDGGATDIVTITVYNYPVPPVVWFSYGTSNPTGTIDVNITNPSLDVSVTNIPDVTVSGNVAIEGSPANLTNGSIVNLSGASEQLFAANPARKYLLIQNIAANNIGVNIDGGAAAIGTAGTITLIPGASIEMNIIVSNQQINIIGTLNDDVTAYEG